MLSWTSTTVDGCQATGGWLGSRPLNGSDATSALIQSTTFNLACSGPGGSINRSVTVAISEIGQQPNVTLSSNRNLINSGDSRT